MRTVFKISLAAAALGLGTVATPALADAPVATLLAGDPCSDAHLVIGGQSAIACVGYFSTNLLQGSPGQATPADALVFINTLLTDTPNPPGVQDSGPGYSPPYNLDVSSILDNIEGLNGASSFQFANDTALSGLTVIGAHFGNAPDAPDNDITAFWLFDLTGSSDTVSLFFDGQLNGQGSSNAQVYATGLNVGVPEPSTWALMLLGFGGIGMALRRSRKRNPALMQVA